MKKKWIPAAICIYIALFIVCLIVVYAVPSVKGLLEKTYIAEYGSLDITDEVSGFIVRDETVYVAAHDSTVNRLADADTLVKAGTQVVELTPEPIEDGEEEEVSVSMKYRNVMDSLGNNVKNSENGYSKVAGYVTYFVDGSEAKLSTDKLADLSRDDYDDLTDMKMVETPSKKVKKGEPIFKITRNHKWYMVFYKDKDSVERYTPGRTINVEIAGRNVPVRVESVEEGDKLAKVTLSCKMFFDGFFETRSLDTVITLASAQGLILQDESIVENGDGQIGVFVKNKLGQHIFKPIALKADDGTKSVAYSDIYVNAEGNFVETIKTYDEIVIVPTEEDLVAIGANVEEGAGDSQEPSETD